MRFILPLCFIAQVLIFQPSIADATCDDVITQLRSALPGPISRSEWINIVNIVLNVMIRNREGDKVQAQIEVDQSVVGARYAAAIAGTPFAQILDFNNRYSVIRKNVTDDLEKAWFDIFVKELVALSARDPTVADLTALFDKFRTDCVAGQTVLDAAVKTARDGMVKLTTDALVPLTGTQTVLSPVFDRCQLYLNSRMFDSVLPQTDAVVLNSLVGYNYRLTVTLRGISNTVIIKINVSNGVKKVENIQAVNVENTAFKPAGDAAAVSIIVSPLRADAEKSINAMRNQTLAEVRAAAITFCTDYSKKVDDAYAKATATIGTSFITAVNKVLAINPTA